MRAVTVGIRGCASVCISRAMCACVYFNTHSQEHTHVRVCVPQCMCLCVGRCGWVGGCASQRTCRHPSTRACACVVYALHTQHVLTSQSWLSLRPATLPRRLRAVCSARRRHGAAGPGLPVQRVPASQAGASARAAKQATKGGFFITKIIIS